jgi:hypothetical protein
MKNVNKINENIYITSDEEIKEGDWYVCLDNSIRQASRVWDTAYGKCPNKKIILTTDNQLIQDGVQAIDDDFLEWFVNNPSCEFVEVEEFEPIYGHQNNSNSVLYKIIIPKEDLGYTTKMGIEVKDEFEEEFYNKKIK